MANKLESGPEWAPEPFDPAGYMQVQIPDLPYSKVLIPWGADFASYARQMRELRDALAAEFWPAESEQEAAPPPPPEPNAARPQQRPQATSGQRGTASPPPRTGGRPASNPYGVTLYCPEHEGALLSPSVKNKTMDYVESILRQIPASWFHTLPGGKSCSVYQSQAIWGLVTEPAAVR